MDSQIILSNVAENVCYTAAEWSAMVAQINSDTYTALWTGLIIGAVVGAAGLYLGIRYNATHRK
jgi:Na+/H+ antiporter NhaD/arsenite permease-like protein